jgi:hypothetical protein
MRARTVAPTASRRLSFFAIGEKLFQVFDTLQCKGDGGYVVEVQDGEAADSSGSMSMAMSWGSSPGFTEQLGDAGDGKDVARCRHRQAARAIRLARAQCQGSSSCNREAG